MHTNTSHLKLAASQSSWHRRHLGSKDRQYFWGQSPFRRTPQGSTSSYSTFCQPVLAAPSAIWVSCGIIYLLPSGFIFTVAFCAKVVVFTVNLRHVGLHNRPHRSDTGSAIFSQLFLKSYLFVVFSSVGNLLFDLMTAPTICLPVFMAPSLAAPR